MNSVVVFLIAFAAILGGAAIGAFLRRMLPGHHLGDDTKDVMRLGTSLIGWMAALVLGLLIASANSAYDSQSTQVTRMTANIILLDELLAAYGPETREARVLMRNAIGPLANRIWHEHASGAATKTAFEESAAGEAAFVKIQELQPQTELQRAFKARAVQATTDIAQSRLLLFEQTQGGIPRPFLAVLMLWLAIIFATYSLFSRPNPTLLAALFVFAFSAASAIFLIVELSQPFTGLMQIPSAPLVGALAPLGP